ncbi:VacJ family lipoprotein [Simiduia aestuariiviva]|uniref:Phospholipid-binding lipoprotein MlaA n=1 Tax=Simiduia aestuariiviva TaxID=1510459 RepID=A0A839UR83_9GAMM|nr:phospholipid-binding lipoprotein MlaA [Simiduia aestuariiviva]
MRLIYLSVRQGLLALALLMSTPVLAADDATSEDPWEGFNRTMFTFNSTLDRYFMRPLAIGYTAVLPDPVEVGVDNVFANLRELTNVFNDVLQWKWDAAANDTARFLINSTVGLAGVFDVAGHFGLRRSDGEDFGQTLAVWGVPEGPYVILPFLGPSTVTRTLSIPMDLDTVPVAQIEDAGARYGVLGLRLVSMRAQLLPLEKSMSGDHYVFIRSAYLQNRQFLINDGVVEDDFGGASDDYGDYDY